MSEILGLYRQNINVSQWSIWLQLLKQIKRNLNNCWLSYIDNINRSLDKDSNLGGPQFRASFQGTIKVMDIVVLNYCNPFVALL